MLRPILWATIVVATVLASGDFMVLWNPESVVFSGNDKVNQSLLKDVFTSVLGFPINPVTYWSGVGIRSPLDLPEAVVVIAVEGIEHLKSQNDKTFPLNNDEPEEGTWQALSGMLEQRGNKKKPVRMYMGDGVNALGQSALGTLKPTPIEESSLKLLSRKRKEDLKILEEIQLLDAIAKNVPSHVSENVKSDVYWFVVSGMQPLIELHGRNSSAVEEALVFLNHAIRNVTDAFVTAYKKKVVIAAFTNDASEVRNTRAIKLSRERRADVKLDDSDKNNKAPENASSTPIIDSVKNDDEEEIEKNGDEGTDTRMNAEGSSLKKSDVSPPITESYEARSENTGTEANEARESSTVKTNLELENTTRNSEQFNTDTENTNRSFKIEELKLAKRYSENYPVIFNIFLWFGVVFFFSLLAICITIADMDPGRDSIIYRMTSTRMKKDN